MIIKLVYNQRHLDWNLSHGLPINNPAAFNLFSSVLDGQFHLVERHIIRHDDVDFLLLDGSVDRLDVRESCDGISQGGGTA